MASEDASIALGDKNMRSAKDPEDNVGLVFNRLQIIGTGIIGSTVNGQKKPRQYECRCDCGNITYVPLSKLKSGNTKSCGCLSRSANGLGDTPEYKVWKEMWRRCSSEKHKRYGEWGGRGIKVCERWGSFDNFLSDMGLRPGVGYTIERTDNSAGYEPDNCIWATHETQANNQSSNRVLQHDGRAQSMVRWCRELGLNYYTVRSRLLLVGWAVDKALSTPTPTKG